LGQTKGRGSTRPSVAYLKSYFLRRQLYHCDREKQAAERDGANKASQFLHISFLLLAAQPNGRVVPWKASFFMFSLLRSPTAKKFKLKLFSRQCDCIKRNWWAAALQKPNPSFEISACNFLACLSCAD
jgi:hypothetical protein